MFYDKPSKGIFQISFYDNIYNYQWSPNKTSNPHHEKQNSDEMPYQKVAYAF